MLSFDIYVFNKFINKFINKYLIILYHVLILICIECLNYKTNDLNVVYVYTI